MTNNSDGLTPTLRPQLGVGWNRALPAPFGFDLSIQPDGINDFLSIPKLCQDFLPNHLTFEYWLNLTSKNYDVKNQLHIVDFVNNKFFKVDGFNNSIQLNSSGATGYGYTGTNSIVNGNIYHIVYTFNFVNGLSHIYINGNMITIGNSNLSTVFKPTRFLLFCNASDNLNQNNYSSNITDEFRIYNSLLSAPQIQLNYNNGTGNNPCVTENLICWYKFQEFENLDFSALQDGSDMRLGIRDHSGKNNHAQPMNMDTNPASGTYVLKPF